MTRKHQQLIAIIGPSGAGKSTLIKQYLTHRPYAHVHRTVTTRPARSLNDDSHIFVDDITFEHMFHNGDLLGTFPYEGYRYGLTPINYANASLVFIALRAPVVAQFLSFYPNTFVIQIEARTETLCKRLHMRGDSSRAQAAQLEAEITSGRSIASRIISTDTAGAYHQFEELCDSFFSM